MRRFIFAIFSLMLAMALLLALQWLVPERAARPRLGLAGSVDFDRLFDSITTEHVRQTHQHIVKPPSRLAGTAGDLAASRYVESEFRRLGLEVLIQSYPVTVPVTKWCRVEVASREAEVAGRGSRVTNREAGGGRREGGTTNPDPGLGTRNSALASISLHPFWPNHVRTCTTGPEGISGMVIDGGTGRLEDLDGKEIEGNILLLRMTPDNDWLSAAKLGAAAILFRPATDPATYANKFLKFPAHLPRFLARGPVDELIGKRVRIDARVDWEVHTARNVFGVLRAPQPGSEALVQIAFTDSWSVVPDLAPGSYEACSVTALLASARALAAQQNGLVRHTIFVACSGRSLGSIGPRRIIDALGLRDRFDANYALLTKRLTAAEHAHDAMQKAVAAARDGDYWQLGADEETRLWDRYGQPAREALSSVVSRLIDVHIDELSRQATAAKLAWEGAGRPDRGDLLEGQIEAVRALRRARTAAGVNARSLKRHHGAVLESSRCRERLPAALDDALSHARSQLKFQKDTNRVADLLGPIERSYFLILAPSTHGKRLRYECNDVVARELERARDAIVLRWLGRTGRRAEINEVDRHLIRAFSSSDLWSYTGPNRVFPVEKDHKNIFMQMSRVIAYSLHTPLLMVGTDLPEGYQTPLDTRVSYEDLAGQAQLMTAVAAHILSAEQPISLPNVAGWLQKRWFSDIGGDVVTMGGSESILPSRHVPDALVVLRGMLGRYFHIQKARDGVFRFPAIEVGAGRLLADAFTIDPPSGEITGARDMGVEGQRFQTSYYKRAQFKEPETRITLLLARMAPTDLYHLIGPASQPVTLEPLDAVAHSSIDQFAITHDWDNGATVFVRPGRRFDLLMRNYPHYRYYHREIDRSGKFTKGFLTGFSRAESRVERSQATSDSALRTADAGPGYLSGRDRRVIFQEVDAASSVAGINRARLNRQVKHGLADPVNLRLAERAESLLESGLEALRQKRYTKAYRDLNESAALSMRAYPTVRTALIDAVNGILLYMFLCVPFALFAERLLLGASDIRARIAGTFAIFLLTFLLIRATHPAYEMINSPMIVLVGFVIFMLCLLILSFISGKFAERMAALRRAALGAEVGAGAAGESDISRAAATAAAFTLGINNMRKRKMRTACTAGTLVLVSFCLVCFTAPRPQWLERRIVVGPSKHDGVMLRFERVAAGHLDAAKDRFGDRATVIGRRSVSQPGWGCHYVPRNGRARSSNAIAVLFVQREEARVSGMDGLLRAGHWFERNDQRVCYLSDVIAAELGIDPADLDRDKGPPIEILLSGWPIHVAGIFDGAALDALRDADGETILPEHDGRFTGRNRLEQRTLQVAGRPGSRNLRPSHIAGTRTILMPLNPERNGLVSFIALLFEGQSHGDKLETINRIMDSSPTYISYALDGLSFFGGKFRFVGLEALVDVVVPLLIASFIVFNTMLGSVYERRGEISVYSAVGLSPRHVFFLFLAESLVYAVIGVVGGYLLALGFQWLSHHSGDLIGITVHYSSRSAIYVTVILMLAVVVSTFIPAWQAARIASPAEQLSWSVPSPREPGRLVFRLPFTYVGREILAVVPFLSGWFDAHGEDASAEFSASAPHVKVQWHGRSRPVFTVTATAWLRPYDLGVSQHVRVSIEPSEAAEHVYAAVVEIQMLSGNEMSWQRTNKRFIGMLRRHLLTWRTLSAQRKHDLFEATASQLGSQVL